MLLLCTFETVLIKKKRQFGNMIITDVAKYQFSISLLALRKQTLKMIFFIIKKVLKNTYLT